MDRAKVGVGVIIVRDGKVLLIRRTGSHGSGTWSVPGGHIDGGESPSETAVRETKEETNIDIDGADLVGVTNDVFEAEGKHYVTLWMRSRGTPRGEVTLNERESSDYAWFDHAHLPSPRFVPFDNLLAGRSMVPFDFRSLFP